MKETQNGNFGCTPRKRIAVVANQKEYARYLRDNLLDYFEGLAVVNCYSMEELEGKERRGLQRLEDLSADDLKAIDERLTVFGMPDLSPKACVERRTSYGGTAPGEVLRQAEAGEEWLARFCAGMR